MCFTIEIHKTRTEIEIRFNRSFAPGSDEFEPRYYVSAFEFPKLPVINQENPGYISMMNWGLIPFWSKNEREANSIRVKTLNAKAETLNEKPSFKQSIVSRRCLIVAHGFFEWQHAGNKKIPHYIRFKDDSLFAFAGIYDKWINEVTGEEITGFSVITCEANPLLAQIHNSKKRMPVILRYSEEEAWIDNKFNDSNAIKLLKPIDEKYLEAWPVSNLINNKYTNKNRPELIAKENNTIHVSQLKLF
jgi:putative SOS response-associated peptidase YedK